MSVTIDYDRNAMLHVLGLVDGRNHVIAACKAIDAVSLQAVKEGRDEMRAVFENPSRFTLGAMTRTTTKNGVPSAFVGINYKARYLDPQVTGGPRKRSKSEALLNPSLSPKRYMVPINPSKKRPAELNRVLSYLQSARDPNANVTEKSLKRNKYLKQVRYMVDKKGGQSRIFALDNSGGRWRRLIYAGAAQPQYKKRLDIESVVDAVMFVHFKPEYERAFLSYQETHR